MRPKRPKRGTVPRLSLKIKFNKIQSNMKNLETVKANILKNEDFKKYARNNEYYDVDDFIRDAKRYIKAIKEGRIICLIDKVSSSGMSRNIKFLECGKSKYEKSRYQYLNFMCFFKALGYSEVKKTGTFRIHGCGMDMIFHTNYTNIHRLHRLGFISKTQCESLAQNTPTVI